MRLGSSSQDNKSSQNVNITSHEHRYLCLLRFPGKVFLIDLKPVIYNPFITVKTLTLNSFILVLEYYSSIRFHTICLIRILNQKYLLDNVWPKLKVIIIYTFG